MIPDALPDITAKIEFYWPAEDLVAVIPYVLPLTIMAIFLLFYWRNLPPTDSRRNSILGTGIFCILVASFLVTFAGFGGGWLTGVEFGSWDTFIVILVIITDLVFGSVWSGLIYLLGVLLIVAAVAKLVVTPVDVDLRSLQEDLKETKELSEGLREQVQKLEGENKQLNEFLSDREDSLSTLQSELDSFKDALAATPLPSEDDDLLATISEKDTRITKLEEQLIELEKQIIQMVEATPITPPTPAEAAASPELEEKQRTLEEYRRRADTATQVADSVISDTVEIISRIQSSKLDEAAKMTLINLTENLGRALGRVAGPPEKRDSELPQIEMIGAVMMVHEILDSIKKITRS
ncbi:MAG: hypothetical protein RTU30_16065 [Candidatus Thorarchaeota archaeon]